MEPGTLVTYTDDGWGAELRDNGFILGEFVRDYDSEEVYVQVLVAKPGSYLATKIGIEIIRYRKRFKKI